MSSDEKSNKRKAAGYDLRDIYDHEAQQEEMEMKLPEIENDEQMESDYLVNTAPTVATATWNINQSSPSPEMQFIGVASDIITDVNVPNTDNMSTMTSRVGQFTGMADTPFYSRTGRPPIQLYLTCDDDAMSAHQCFVRKHIELFEADFEDIESNAQGRNKPIVLGQVGVRCRHCNELPPSQRKRGAVYYPAKLDGIYQAANNLAVVHLGEYCQMIDDRLRNHLTTLRNNRSTIGGGKKIWAERAANLGVFEDDHGLRFEPSINYRQRNYLEK
jgi:hypothetical protein